MFRRPLTNLFLSDGNLWLLYRDLTGFADTVDCDRDDGCSVFYSGNSASLSTVATLFLFVFHLGILLDVEETDNRSVPFR